MAKIKIESSDNPLIKHLVKLRINRIYRKEQQSIILSGKSLIFDIAKYIPLKTLLLEEGVQSSLHAEKSVFTTLSILKKISGVENPDGCVAEVAMPLEKSLNACEKVIAFNGVRDPGNMGTLLRSALAFGWDGAYLLPGSCDPFNDKALRAARGAQLLLPLAHGDWNSLKNLAIQQNWRTLVADIEGENIKDFSCSERILLILGNEAQGVDSEIKNWGRKIMIPMSSQMESLNVSIAGSILMYMLNSSNL